MNVLIGIGVLLALAAVFYFAVVKRTPAGGDSEADAKRRARLLVSEIELYDRQKVLNGRRDKNLSDALRDEIGRARDSRRKRFSNREFGAHCENAPIEILAEGDRSKLDSVVKSSFR